MAKTAATDGIANLVNCCTYVKHETIKNLHYFIGTDDFWDFDKGKPYEVSKLSNERFLLALLPTSVGLY